MKHTPGPWIVGKNGRLQTIPNIKGGCTVIISESLKCNPDADFIVTACNCFDDLLEALKDATNQLECSGYCFDHPALTPLRAAIAKAEGRE